MPPLSLFDHRPQRLQTRLDFLALVLGQRPHAKQVLGFAAMDLKNERPWLPLPSLWSSGANHLVQKQPNLVAERDGMG